MMARVMAMLPKEKKLSARAEFLLAYQRILDANAITKFKAYEGADVGRVAHDSRGREAILQPPPADLWVHSLDVWHVLEWLRIEAGEGAIGVNSGWRDPTYNALIGGAPNSMHALFIARDVTLAHKKPVWVARRLEKHPQGNMLGIGLYNSFVHVDTRGLAQARGLDVGPAQHPARWKAKGVKHAFG